VAICNPNCLGIAAVNPAEYRLSLLIAAMKTF